LAQIESPSAGLVANTFAGDKPAPPTCATTPRDSYIQLSNLGTGSGSATGVTITSGGVSNDFTINGPCKVGPAGSPTATTYVNFRGLSELSNSSAPVAGQQYVGSVTLADGVPILFTGRFGEGQPQVSVTGIALPAASFGQGKPINATCVTTPVPADSYIMLTNAGTAEAAVTSVSITWKNATNVFSISGLCNVGLDGTPSSITYLNFGSSNSLAVAAVAGQSFTGTLTLSTGTQIPFSGEFQ